MAAVKGGSLNMRGKDMLGLRYVKDTLHDVFTSNKRMIDGEMLKSPVPKPVLQEDCFQ